MKVLAYILGVAVFGLFVWFLHPDHKGKPDYTRVEGEFISKKPVEFGAFPSVIVGVEDRFLIVRLLKNGQDGGWSLFRVFKSDGCAYAKGDEVVFRKVRYDRSYYNPDTAWFADCRK